MVSVALQTFYIILFTYFWSAILNAFHIVMRGREREMLFFSFSKFGVFFMRQPSRGWVLNAVFYMHPLCIPESHASWWHCSFWTHRCTYKVCNLLSLVLFYSIRSSWTLAVSSPRGKVHGLWSVPQTLRILSELNKKKKKAVIMKVIQELTYVDVLCIL